MAEQSLRLRLGLFVATALGVLTVLVVLFGGTPTLFANRAKYTILFPEAPGIAPGTPVRKSGVRIGEVTTLDLDESSGQVRVNVEVDPLHAPRTGEDAVITRGFLSGDTALDFVPKTTAEGPATSRGEPHPRGTEIAGVPPVSARTLLGQAQSVIPNAQESLVRMSESVQKFERAAPKIEKAAEEFGALSKAAREFLPELQKTNTKVQDLLGAGEPQQPDPLKQPDDRVTVRAVLQDIRDLLRAIKPVADDLRAQMKSTGPELDKTLKALQQTLGSTNELLNPENRKAVAALLQSLQVASEDLTKTIRLAALVLDNAEKTVKEFNLRAVQSEKALANIERATRPFAENAEPFQRDVAETVKNLNAVSADLSRTLRVLTQSEGTVQKLISDPSLYNNINESAVGVARILARLEKVSRDLEVFADKIARKPETIGVGGALHPSTGLKESPTAPLPQTPVAPLPPASMPSGGPITPIAPVPLGAGEPIPVYKPAGETDLPPKR
ncbi:MAG TPA: MlaD family protein [Fimbriiglobus sp.]|jgi:ABC-type transporter Mla subunit MlaD|nr:MlaD family protein [Fimbriiglobus sp.]